MALTTMYPGFVNSPSTTLTGDITDIATTIPVTELGVFPAAPNLAVIGTGDDAETIYYGAKSAATGAGNLTTVTREFNKTGTYGAKKAWSTGEVIARNFTEYDYDAITDNITNILSELDAFVYKGAIDCSGNPNYPAADIGHVYLVSAAGLIGGAAGPAVEVSDMLICHVDSSASGDHATVGANWSILQKSAVDEGSILLSDVTTNDVSTAKHGFCPKRSGLSGNFLDGAGTWDTVQETDLGFSDLTTSDASTTKHGFLIKATAPAAGIRNVVAIDNGETVYKNAALLDDTNPAALGTASPGTSLVAARRDHVHTLVKGGVSSWSEVTGTTQACAVNIGYILNNAALVTATLPSTAAVGDVIRIVGKGAGMWKVAQNASQYIRFAGLTTTTGTGGYLQAENAYDCVELICTTANVAFTVISSIGNIVVV